MWSPTGQEYSGRISVTCSGVKCIPWYRSIHKLKNAVEKMNGTIDRSLEGILDRFPDRSLSEASNYCRNPTRDLCGPWCYTSLADDSKQTCCVPDCTAANKGCAILTFDPWLAM